MRKLSHLEITSRRLPPEELKKMERFPFLTLLDNVRSLYNVGSVFRTADAVRLKKLYLAGITGKPPRKEIDKTALGAVDTVPWEYRDDAVALVRELREQGVQVIVLEHTSESRPFEQLEINFPACLVVGNEVFGVQDKIVEMADAAIEIPMFGNKQSLNVTIAYGIVIYHFLYQFLAKKS